VARSPAAFFEGGPVPASPTDVSSAPAPGVPIGRYRWVICALLFFATTINYVDRQVIGLLKPTLQAEFGWTEIDYANIVFAFQMAYAIGLVVLPSRTPKLPSSGRRWPPRWVSWASSPHRRSRAS
jgi:hypothetical protein